MHGHPQSPKGSCLLLASDAGPALLCTEFTGSIFTPDSIIATCSELTAGSTLASVYSTQPCASASILGRCITSCALPGESVGYYYPVGGRTVAPVQQACTTNGGYFLP